MLPLSVWSKGGICLQGEEVCLQEEDGGWGGTSGTGVLAHLTLYYWPSGISGLLS